VLSAATGAADFLDSDRPWVPHPVSKREREKAAAANALVAVPAAPPPSDEPREPAADTRFNQPD